jgi:hypothetical protein
MAATFDDTLPTDRDWIRAALGDTDTSNAWLSDERINAVLTAAANDRTVATLQLCEQLITLASQEPVEVSISGLSVDYSAQIAAWKDLANRLRADIAADQPGTKSTRASSQSIRHKVSW